MDLPTEVVVSGIFPYLTRKELKGIRLNKRLKDIADSVIEKMDRKGKYNLYFLLNENGLHPCALFHVSKLKYLYIYFQRHIF